jgi:N-acetylglucosamine kinase-like BadF-type ATPase
MPYVMSIDGGGSKIACLVSDLTGRLSGFGVSGPVNTNYVGRKLVIESIRSAISTCLRESDLESEQVETLNISAPIAPDILEEGILPFNIRQVNRAAEGETPRWAARYWIDERIGVTVDAGTGSLARGWSADGREAGAGGWGATMGDEGSGYWIGMQAMIAILHAADGRISPTRLTNPVLDHFGFSGLLDMVFKVSHGLVKTRETDQIGVIPDSNQITETGDEPEGGIQFHKRSEKEPLSRYEVASLCPIVEKIASAGDDQAIEIFNRAGIELGKLACAVINRLEMTEDRFAVIPFGGAFRAGGLILDSFSQTVQLVAPLAQITRPKFEPVVGGILLALDQHEVQINDQVIQSIEASSIQFPQIMVKQ